MLLTIILLFFILPTLNAPTWCFILTWITFIIQILRTILKPIKEAIKNYKKDLESA